MLRSESTLTIFIQKYIYSAHPYTHYSLCTKYLADLLHFPKCATEYIACATVSHNAKCLNVQYVGFLQ